MCSTTPDTKGVGWNKQTSLSSTDEIQSEMDDSLYTTLVVHI